MGGPPQRAARLHFRATSISWENAHGPGSFEHRRACAGGRAKRSARRSGKSCGLARAAGRRTHTERCSIRRKSKSSGKGRFAAPRCTSSQSSCIASTGRFSCSLAGTVCRFASASGFSSGSRRIASSAFCFASAKSVSSSESEGTARFGISLSRGKGKSGRITKPASGFSCNIARGFSKFASAKGAGWSGSKGASRFAISGSGGERPDGHPCRAGVQRGKREPGGGREPLSIWLLAVYGPAVFSGGAYLGRYSGNFSGDALDPYGGEPQAMKKAAGPQGAQQVAELSPRDRGKKIFAANCQTCHQANGLGVPGQYPPLAGSVCTTGGSRRPALFVLI